MGQSAQSFEAGCSLKLLYRVLRFACLACQKGGSRRPKPAAGWGWGGVFAAGGLHYLPGKMGTETKKHRSRVRIISIGTWICLARLMP